MNEHAIRIVLIDDDTRIHDAIAHILKATGDLKLVAQGFDGAEALHLCRATRADIVLMDVIMPGVSGVQATQQVLSTLPHLKILALSSFNEYEYIKAMLDAGAIGYLVKDALVADLADTIRSTLKGNTVLSPQVARLVFNPPADAALQEFGLTKREHEVLSLLAQGHTNAQIAHELNISQPTVRFHLNNVLDKLGVQTRSEALVLAAHSGLI